MRALQAIIFVCVLLLAKTSHTQVIDAPFDRLQDKAWAVVITGSEFDPLYLEQISYFMPAAEIFVKREIVTIHFKDRSLDIIPELTVFKYQLPRLNENRDTNLLEGLLQTDDDIFSVVLVNKTGATQYVWLEPIRPEALFSMMDNPVPMVEPETAPETKK
jgi:hypothetical protein